MDVAALKAAAAGSAGDDPWARARRSAASSDQRDVRGGMAPPADEPSPGETSRGHSHPNADREWPLKMPGLLGAITFKDRSLFDDKVMLSAEYHWDGTKGGANWKSRVERYFITKAPVLRELLEWAEAQDAATISEAQVVEATSRRLTEEQAMVVNAQI